MISYINKRVALAAMLFATVMVSPLQADDTEIFFNQDPLVTGEPLVMFSLDYRSNLGSPMCEVGDADCDGDLITMFAADGRAVGDTVSFLGLLRASLRSVLSNVTGVKVGLMLNHDYVNNCENSVTAGCSNGGYIAEGFKSVNGAAANGGEDAVMAKLTAIPIPSGNLAHPFQGKELYFEFYRYLTGKSIHNGHVGFTDYADDCSDDNLDGLPNNVCDTGHGSNAVVHAHVGSAISWDTTIEDGSNYISPFEADDSLCSRVFAINFMFNVSSQDSGSDAAIEGDMTGISLSGNSGFSSVIDWMWQHDLADADAATTYDSGFDREGDQNVTSYFIYGGQGGNTMDANAEAGGTSRAIDMSTLKPKQFVEALSTILAQITRQNATFEAPAVTVNSYTRLTHRDELYYALFGPEIGPNWPGNLKKYKMHVQESTGTLQIVDKDGLPAIDANGSVFYSTACSFWSDCTIDRDGDNTADDDGDTVDWGGAAELVTIDEDTDRSRKVIVDIGGVNKDVHEDTTEITAAMLGIDPSKTAAAQALERTRVLQQGRGLDPDDTSQALQTMGDPIHARPTVISYNDDINNSGLNPTMAIAMTTNEGFFHLFAAETGYEYFAFMPGEELLPQLKAINGPDAVTGVGGDRYDTYGLDGSPVVWRHDDNDDGVIEVGVSDHVYVYLTQRRGGRNIYAMDITDPNNPALKWKILGGTGSFEELGQTWSEPSLAWIKVNDVATAVLVFGGGYDPAQDDAYSRTDSMGRAIYVVNAKTGEVIWQIDSSNYTEEMVSSIPTSIITVDVLENGYMDRLYAVDVVGRVFRVDFDNTGSSSSIYGGGLVASLMTESCAEGAPVSGVAEVCQRRFYNAPDVAVMSGKPNYVQIAVGSGFRAHPVMVTGIQDNFYVVFDPNVSKGVLKADYAADYHWAQSSGTTGIIDMTTFVLGQSVSDTNATASAKVSQPDVHGWYINMELASNEKVLSRSLTIDGKIIFTTYLRSAGQANACIPDLGQGRIYVLNPFNGMPVTDFTDEGYTDVSTVDDDDRYDDLGRGGIPPDPVIYFDDTGPRVLVGTEIQDNLLPTTPYNKTWWIDVEPPAAVVIE
jgi:type IV pilus assembly protein PilY1